MRGKRSLAIAALVAFLGGVAAAQEAPPALQICAVDAASGIAVPNAVVILVNSSGGAATLTAGSSGCATAAGLKPGNYKLSVFAAGTVPADMTFRWPSTKTRLVAKLKVQEATQAKIAVLLVPGIGTKDNLRHAREAGASVARIATHCTEADVSIQHFGLARDLGMETVGFLMMAHKTTPAELARQARIMVDAGAECVYCVDSAGALVLGDAQERVQAIHAEIGHQAEIGFHGHQNLSLGVANSVLAYQHGARQIDGALCALGAGAGNSPTEVLAATFDHLGVQTGLDVGGVLAAAEEVVRPFLPRWPKMDRSAIVQGWAGVYSSFLLHAERAAERYGVPAHEILQRAGELGYVGGQEDMIIDIALGLAQERDLAATGAR